MIKRGGQTWWWAFLFKIVNLVYPVLACVRKKMNTWRRSCADFSGEYLRHKSPVDASRSFKRKKILSLNHKTLHHEGKWQINDSIWLRHWTPNTTVLSIKPWGHDILLFRDDLRSRHYSLAKKKKNKSAKKKTKKTMKETICAHDPSQWRRVGLWLNGQGSCAMITTIRSGHFSSRSECTRAIWDTTESSSFSYGFTRGAEITLRMKTLLRLLESPVH